MSDDDGLPKELTALLDLERAAAGPSEAVKARVLERLEHSLGLSGNDGGDGGDGGDGSDGGGGGGGGSASASSSSAPASSAASASSSGLNVAATLGVSKATLGGGALAVAVLGLVAGALVGVFGGERELSAAVEVKAASAHDSATLAADDVQERASDDEPAHDRAADLEIDDDAAFVLDESELRVEAAPSPSQRSARAPAARSESSTLAEEQALLDAARSALAAGELSAAERTLRRHAEAFPRGQLAEERSALLVLTLARAGRSDDANHAAAAFRKRWPESLHRATVDAALEH